MKLMLVGCMVRFWIHFKQIIEKDWTNHFGTKIGISTVSVFPCI